MSIGVDIVRITRFEKWVRRDNKQLAKIYTAHERAMLLKKSNDQKVIFLASRFAVKEAFYKLLSEYLLTQNHTKSSFSFLSCARFVSLNKNNTWGVPQLAFDASGFSQVTGVSIDHLPKSHIAVSLSHDGDYAIAMLAVAH